MYLALREMRFAKARYSLIAAIMTLIAFLTLFVTGLARGLAYDNAASVQNMPATHFILEQHSDHRFTRSQVGDSQLAAARSIAGGDQAEPLGLRMGTVIADGDTMKLDVTYLAVNADGWLAPVAAEGEAFASLKEGQVLVDEKLSESGIRIGSVLVDQATGLSWTVGGFVRDESYSHSPVVFLNMQDWKQQQGRLPVRSEVKSAQERDVYNAIAVQVTKEQADALQAALPSAEVVRKSDAVSAIPGYREEQSSLLMMIVFLFVISAFVLAVFFYVMTIQKTSQFGILKAIGTRTGYLAGSVTVQVLLLSAGSLLVSLLLVQVISMLLPGGMPFQLSPSTLLLTCSSFIAMSLAGSLFSVWKVAGVDALDAIGRTA